MDAPRTIGIGEGIALLAMNRPGSGNPLDPGMRDALSGMPSAAQAVAHIAGDRREARAAMRGKRKPACGSA